MKIKYYSVNDVMEILDVSDTTAYRIIAQLNEELKAQGYLIPKRGRVSCKYFHERCNLDNEIVEMAETTTTENYK